MKHLIIYLGLVIILAISISINVFLFKELKTLKTSVQVEENIVVDHPESLADAIVLLPNPEEAIAGRKISDGLYWVWAKIDKGTSKQQEQSWVVDLQNQTATKISERNLSPVGGNVWVDELSDKYLEVDWSGGWEGFSINAKEFFARQTGQLIYTLIVNSGQNAELLASDKDFKIDFAPSNLCDSVSFGNETKESATGLEINGQVFDFPKPLEINCTFNDMSGQKMHENFGFFVLSEGEQVIRLGMPGNTYAEIPIPSLNLEEINFKNFSE